MRHAPSLAAAAAGLAALAIVPAASQPLGWVTQRLAQPNDQPAMQADPNLGRFVATGGQFGRQRVACLACHQLDGTGDRSGAFPRLTGQSEWYLFSTLRDFAAGLRPSKIMQPVARDLTLSEMQDVAAFYASVANPPYAPPLAQNRDLIAQGRKIAEQGLDDAKVPACTSCHGVGGKGGMLYPFLAGQYQPYLRHELTLFKTGKRKGDLAHVMEAIASKLSDQQIKAVSAYFASLSPAMVTPQTIVQSGRNTSQQQPGGGPVPHLGAAMTDRPGESGVVVPGASTVPGNGR